MRTEDPTPVKPGRWILPILSVVLGVGLFLLGLVVVGQRTRDAISHLDRYTVPFADIDCQPPGGQERAEFFSEVQYLSSLPDQLHLLDDDLAAKLHEAFSRHPWVQKVERVEIVPPGKVQVFLVYRTPVLNVSLSKQKAPDIYQVDGQGVLLRAGGPNHELAFFETKNQPAGPAGTSWEDADVEAAARTAAFLGPYQDQFQVKLIEGGVADLVLKGSFAGRVLWGRPPGAEWPGEATAAQKVERLLEFCTAKGKLGSDANPYEYDVRPIAQALHRPLGRGN